jgi:hypothetical protein
MVPSAAVLEKKEGGLEKMNMTGGSRLSEGNKKKERETAGGGGFWAALLGCPSRVGPVGLGFTFFLFCFLFLFSVFLFFLFETCFQTLV